jgi:2-amino-4-hydroxy-6-hydroxymethyldihydropteridine diphosphokinase
MGLRVAVSGLYEALPQGPPQPDYLNAAVRLATTAPPRALLAGLLELERRYGRERRVPMGPRTLDLDLLWIDGLEVLEPALAVPHPRLQERRFALEPLLDVAPSAVQPRTGEPLRAWLERLPSGGIQKISSSSWAREG